MHVSYAVDFDPLWSRLPVLLLGMVGLILAVLRRERLGRDATMCCAVGCGLLILSATLAIPQLIYGAVSRDLFIGDVFSSRSVADALGRLRDLLGFLALASILVAVFVPRARTDGTTDDRMPPSAS